jgi:F0F1-type ATP synthase assembly protein I
MVDDREPKDQSPRLVVEMARFAHLGFQLALATGLFLLGGWWVDGKLGTTPLLTIVGALTGAGAGFYSIVHHLTGAAGRKQELPRSEEQEREG